MVKVLFIAVDEMPKCCYECNFFHALPSDKKKGYCDAEPNYSANMWTSDAKQHRQDWRCPLQKYNGDNK